MKFLDSLGLVADGQRSLESLLTQPGFDPCESFENGIGFRHVLTCRGDIGSEKSGDRVAVGLREQLEIVEFVAEDGLDSRGSFKRG